MDIIDVATRRRRPRRRRRRQHPVVRTIKRPTPKPLHKPAVKRRTAPKVASPVKNAAGSSAPNTSRTSSSPASAVVPLSPAADRHLLRRFSAGLTPGLISQASAAGGARAWFERQLNPDSVADPRGDEIDTWHSFHNRTPQEFFQRFKDGTEGFWVVMPDLVRWTVARRLESSRQLQEVMVDFWSNHLNVPVTKEESSFARVDYDKVIRANALGSFEQLLRAAITHPAMNVSLNNNTSTKKAPNENLGRELLELHTVGVGSGYTEDDVKNSAKILTGYRVDVWNGFLVSYDTTWHYTGPVKVMDFASANTSSDGRGVTLEYLSYLARHPKTASRIARKLCIKFVRDDPSDGLVSAVAAAYIANGTAIKPTLRALVDHPEFAASQRAKLRTPQEDWQATVRALGITLQKRQSDDSFSHAMYYQFSDLGASPYGWPAPDGYPDAGAPWASAGRMMNGFTVHRSLTAHWWPSADAGLPDLLKLLPALPATLQQVIDTLALSVIGEPPGLTISAGIATALGWPLNHPLAAWEAKNYWTVPTIVATLLDSPLHLYR